VSWDARIATILRRLAARAARRAAGSSRGGGRTCHDPAVPALPQPHRRPPLAALLAALLAATLLLAACGGDDDVATPKSVTVDGARKTGDRAKATAEAIVERPLSIAIRVSAAPKQGVDVSWAMSCPKTDTGKDARPTGGTYTVTPPNLRRIALPKRTIAFCAVNAQAQLTRSGRVKVAVVASEKPKPKN